MSGLQQILNDGFLTLILILATLIVVTAVVAIVVPTIPIDGWRNLGRLFLGVEVPPALVAWTRLIVTGAVSAVVTRVGDWVGVETPDMIITLVVGSLWGILDQWKKAQQNDDNPPRVAGGPDLEG